MGQEFWSSINKSNVARLFSELNLEDWRDIEGMWVRLETFVRFARLGWFVEEGRHAWIRLSWGILGGIYSFSPILNPL